jgi:hypothetical protein
MIASDFRDLLVPAKIPRFGLITRRSEVQILPAQLVAGLENLERHYPAKARTGLKMALHDLLEMTRDFPQPVVDAVNAELRQRCLITLTDMRAREWRTIPKVLSRGRIKTDVEYYLLIERLNDVSTSGLTGEQRASLNGMVAEYESRVSRKP